MKKFLKWFFSILIFLIVLLVGAVLALPYLVDPNEYKDEIISLVKGLTRQMQKKGAPQPAEIIPPAEKPEKTAVKPAAEKPDRKLPSMFSLPKPGTTKAAPEKAAVKPGGS